MVERVSITDAHMKGFPEGRPEANDAHEKQVDGAGDTGHTTDIRPGIFHFPAPVDVIKDINAILTGALHAGVEILHGGGIPVITIEKDQIGGHHVERLREGLVEISA